MRVSYETIGRDGRDHLEGVCVGDGRDPGRLHGKGIPGKRSVSLVASGYPCNRLEDGRLHQVFPDCFGQGAKDSAKGMCNPGKSNLKSEERGIS